ncbi:DEP domain-containing protein 1B-like [Anneissia japonica]|uniref:DEP domain-containing protein 1B-like n=1 Tax=Anneissia japonica TaxID=1529436 RepID=UPI0014254D14|nr:DEP domain-containing protein 1B-like [Anneissia japonica]
MEPFRATRLWNGLIKEFRNGMHPKRHRWRMRHYDNCFTSTEAIEFLLNHLHNDTNFGPWVTRDQTSRLLSKFIENRVIVEVKSSSSKGPFEDDGRLYRLCPSSPIKKLRSALNSRTNLRELAEASPKKRPKSVQAKKLPSRNPPTALTVPHTHTSALTEVNENNFVRRQSARLMSCKYVPRSISKDELEDLWKSSAITRLQRITGVSTIDDFVRVDEIQGRDIIQNSLHINRNNMVIIEDKSQDLPHWVLSAMRCLAHWPDRTDETGLPSYPGFERDVFKTVSNYFHSLSEPLLTYNLYDIITGSFLICDRRDRGLGDSPCELTTPPSVVTSTHLSTFGSVENLMLDLTMGWTPLTKFSGQSTEGINRVGCERRSMRRQLSNVTPVARRKNTSQSPSGGKGNDCHSSGTIFCLTSQKITSCEQNDQDEGWVQPCDGVEVDVAKTSLKELTCCPRKRPQSATVEYDHIRQKLNDPVTDVSPSNCVNSYGFLPMYADNSISTKQVCKNPKRYSSDSNLTSSRSVFCFQRGRLGFEDVQATNTNSRQPQSDLHYASTSCLISSNKDLSPDSGKDSFELSRSRSGSFRNRKKFSSLTNIDIKSDDNKHKKAPRSNLSFSKQFGSASEIFQKLFTKRKDKTTLQDQASCDSKIRPQQVNLAKSNKDFSSLPNNKRQTSPPYPSPLRATISQPVLIGRRNDSGSSIDSFYSAKSNLTRQSISSSSMKWSTPDEEQNSCKHSTSSTSLCLTDDQSYTVEGLKICCLLLPPPNRKKLYLLLKLMTKMVNNKELNLSQHMSTKSLVLQTFWRSILSCEVEVGLDEILAIKVVTYMMEHYDQIMTVSQELKSDVDERILYLRRTQVKFNAEEGIENNPVSYCQKISLDEYKQQKLSHSENAISSLLESIINNKTMPVKVKRKKLKKFQQEYPEIYAKRLPTTSHEAELFPQKPKIKQPMLNMKKSLTKLKSIR